MLRRDFLIKKLVPGTLYRRSELELFSSSVDRHLSQLVKNGTLKKVGPGLLSDRAQSVPPDSHESVPLLA
jgi:hypothetical protein